MPSESLTSLAAQLCYGERYSARRSKKKLIDLTKDWVNLYENPEKCTTGSQELKKMTATFLNGDKKCDSHYFLWENYPSFHLQWPRDRAQYAYRFTNDLLLLIIFTGSKNS